MNRIDFYVDQFRDLINQKGMYVDWEQASVCQCITHDSGQPNFSCPYCKGSGFIYMPKQSIRVLVTSFATGMKFEAMGFREPGTAYATPPQEYLFGYHDRLTFTDFTCKYSERIQFHLEDNMMVSDTMNRNLIDVIALSRDDVFLEPNVDFAITPDRYHIAFAIPDSYPGKWGESLDFSCLYLTRPQYYVEDMVHELRATTTVRYEPAETYHELPKQYKIKRINFDYDTKEFEKHAETSSPEAPKASVIDGMDW